MKIRARRWLIAALILILIALATRWVMQRRAATTGGGQPAPTAAQLVSEKLELTSNDVITVAEQTVTEQVAVSGNVQTARSAWVKARIGGDVREMRVREGDSVQQGQMLGRIDDSDVKERHAQAQRQTEMARAQLQTAQLTYDNNQALVHKNFISQTALINSQANLSSAKANLEAMLAAERIAQKAVADASLIAPFSGQVASVLVQAGERANVDARLIEVVDLKQMEIMVSLNPNEATRLRVGQSAALQIEGVPQPTQAKLQRINPSVDPATRSVRAYLQLSSAMGADWALRQGLFAQGHINVGEARGLAIPLSAVRTDKPTAYVLKVAQGRIAAQNVTLSVRGPLLNGELPRGTAGERWVVVQQGLSAGDQVLSAAVGSVREGLSVSIKTKQGN